MPHHDDHNYLHIIIFKLDCNAFTVAHNNNVRYGVTDGQLMQSWSALERTRKPANLSVSPVRHMFAQSPR